MYKLALFSPVITNDDSLALSKFRQLFKQNILDQPIIFCDNINIFLEEPISIFSSLYMKQKFSEYIILSDIENINYIDQSLKTILLYNDICQNPIHNTMNVKCIPYESDISSVLQEILL